jgi:hypothetical protein
MGLMGNLEPARHKSADLSGDELPSHFFDASGEVKAFVGDRLKQWNADYVRILADVLRLRDYDKVIFYVL